MTPIEIREALREARKRKLWKTTELAERSGLSVATIYAFESGVRSSGLVHLCEIANALGYEVLIKKRAHLVNRENSAANKRRTLDIMREMAERE